MDKILVMDGGNGQCACVMTGLYLFIGWFEFMLAQPPLAATSCIFMWWGTFGSVIEPLAA